MKNKCIIYLGGSITQSVNFEYLKKKNYKIILIDQNPNCYCKKYCDVFLNLSQTKLKEIILSLNKIISRKKYEVVDCFGIAHYSYPAVNLIKKKYINNFKKDYFLMNKDTQKRVLKKYKFTPDFYCLPKKESFKKKRKFYMKKIYSFYKKCNYRMYLKTNGTHQGIGIIKMTKKTNEANFKRQFSKQIYENYKYSSKLYFEKEAQGTLLNIDFVKKQNNQVVFLPLIFRDKVILSGRKKYLSVFQYLNNKQIIDKNTYKKLEIIINNQFNKKKVFGTIDALVDGDKLNILEISPHFHNVKIHKFLNNKEILDLYMNKNSNIKKFFKSKFGGYIFLHEKNKYTEHLYKFVKKYSSKTMIDYIDIKTRESYLKTHAFVKNTFHLIYFQAKTNKHIQKISYYMEKNKKKLYR